jgi:hypothetical protein
MPFGGARTPDSAAKRANFSFADVFFALLGPILLARLSIFLRLKTEISHCASEVRFARNPEARRR